MKQWRRSKKAGYDVQMQAYMWLYDCDVANIDFWLFPCPPELLNGWDDIDQLVHLVEKIDIRERKTTVVIERDEAIIQKIKDKVPHCQEYYAKLFASRRCKVKVRCMTEHINTISRLPNELCPAFMEWCVRGGHEIEVKKDRVVIRKGTQNW